MEVEDEPRGNLSIIIALKFSFSYTHLFLEQHQQEQQQHHPRTTTASATTSVSTVTSVRTATTSSKNNNNNNQEQQQQPTTSTSKNNNNNSIIYFLSFLYRFYLLVLFYPFLSHITAFFSYSSLSFSSHWTSYFLLLLYFTVIFLLPRLQYCFGCILYFLYHLYLYFSIIHCINHFN